MLPKEEYISLLANLFQRGLCLDMIDIDGKQDSPDISDEERISFKAADEALSRVDLDELFDNAEILEIPDKYPEFYEYLRELQLERQEDGHGERTIEDASADEEVEEGEEEPGPEEPQGLSTKDQVLKNIVGGEHTGNQRDSEKYRKGDEMRAHLDEERREALSRAAEQERYDNEHRMSLESKLEDERGEAMARAEEQQRQREALRQKELAERPETTVNITKVACHFLVELIIRLLKTNSIRTAYDAVCREFAEYYTEDKIQSAFANIFSGKILSMPASSVKSSGYVIDTLEAVLWCIFHTTTYKDAVLTAVNLGDDTDTVGAITGGIAGIIYGLNAIPEEWISKLVNKMIVLNAASDLYKKCNKDNIIDNLDFSV